MVLAGDHPRSHNKNGRIAMKLRPLARKALTLLATAALATVSVAGLSACGESQEDAIKSMIKEQFGQLEQVNDDNIEEVFGDDEIAELKQYGIDAGEFYNACIKRFDYEIEDISVSDDTATVKLSVTNVDFATVAASWTDDMNAYLTSSEAVDDYTNLGEDGMLAKVMGLLVEKLAADDAPTKTASVTLDLEKSGKTWEFADEDQVVSAIFAGTDPSNLME